MSRPRHLIAKVLAAAALASATSSVIAQEQPRIALKSAHPQANLQLFGGAFRAQIKAMTEESQYQGMGSLTS